MQLGCNFFFDRLVGHWVPGGAFVLVGGVGGEKAVVGSQ
jgi:hypothetical protein